ncbi:MAG TPA: CvpA family protein [candidate division WOR-3 bacterium]|uniref:CvpA family protein n=1 Tax=candidate division WOR-3 bacterium TaxID=2052148 RepID=A0A7V0T5B8_UNCW3|nr:CvpA family protein [candidate division WOR-3 bacterium]
MNVIDLFLGLVILLAAYAEYSRGLVLALADVLRSGAALVTALVGYTLAARLSGSVAAGFIVGIGLALVVLVVSAVALKRYGEGPEWSRGKPGRLAGGAVGIPLGLVLGFVLLPIAARLPPVARAAEESFFGRGMLDRLPALYEAADAFNLQLPQFEAEAGKFEEEHRAGHAGMAERLNYRRLDRSTCIECGSPVSFRGYRRTGGTRVSPLFVCPDCGRQSDGCQTFEGFHLMYGRCPYELGDRAELDCGVWSNRRPVRPRRACPVCTGEE